MTQLVHVYLTLFKYFCPPRALIALLCLNRPLGQYIVQLAHASFGVFKYTYPFRVYIDLKGND